MNGNRYRCIHWLKERGNIRCDWKVFLKMYLKSYGFYNGTLVASQTRDEIFLYPNLPVNGEFPSERPVTRSFDVWFDLYLNKRLSKQPWGWWVETPSRSLWRRCNADPLNKPFYRKMFLVLRSGCSGLKGLIQWPRSLRRQVVSIRSIVTMLFTVYIQSLKKGPEVWLLKVRHRPGPASWFFSDFVRICAVYQWVVHIISDFVLSYKM